MSLGDTDMLLYFLPTILMVLISAVFAALPCLDRLLPNPLGDLYLDSVWLLALTEAGIEYLWTMAEKFELAVFWVMLSESFVFFLLLALWFIMCCIAILKLCLGFLSVLLVPDFLAD